MLTNRMLRSVAAGLAGISLLLPCASKAAAAEDAPVTVAVLPFTRISSNENDEFLKAGFAEQLTTALTRIGSIRIVERSLLNRLMEEQKVENSGVVDPAQAAKIGKLAGAQKVVLGSFIRAGQTMRVNCRFVVTETGEVDKAHAVQKTQALPNDEAIFELLDALSEDVVKSFGAEVTPEQKAQIQQVTQATSSGKAFELYARGREEYLRMTLAGWQRAADLFQQAVDADAKYALAWAGLAESRRLWGFQLQQRGDDANSMYQKALDAANKAVELAPKLPEAHRALAAAYLHYADKATPKDERRQRAQQEAREAIRLNPQDAEAHLWLWEALGAPLDEADEQYARKAIELNPNLVVAYNDLGAIMAGRGGPYEGPGATLASRKCWLESERLMKKAVELSPDSAVAVTNLAQIYIGMGRLDEADALFSKALRIDPENVSAQLGQGMVLQFRGRADEAVRTFMRIAQEHPNFASVWGTLAPVYVAVGNPAGAAAALRRFIELADPVLGWEEDVKKAKALLAQFQMMGL